MTENRSMSALRWIAMPGSIAIFAMVAACAVAPPTRQSFAPDVAFEEPGQAFPDLRMGRMAQWSRELAEGGEVVIDNPYGDVYVRHNRGGRRVGISGVIQRLGADPEIERLQLTASDAEVVLRVSYPGDGRRRPMTPSGRPGRVDLSVLVPDDTTLTIRTRDGKASGKRVKANLIVETESGDIDFSSSGWVRASTDTGRISIVLAGDQWGEPVTLESVAGDIEVELLTRVSAGFEIQTHGQVFADPMALGARLSGTDGRRTGVWGKPGADSNQIRIASRSGDVNISLYGMDGDLPEP